MTNTEELRRLNSQLEKSLDESKERADVVLRQGKRDLNASIFEAVKQYSSEIRSIIIISGVIAPFSLTILQIESINVYAPSLLFGFCLLLSNIGMAQCFIYLETRERSSHVRMAIKHLLLADMLVWKMGNKESKLEERVAANFDQLSRFDEVNRALGNTGEYDAELYAAHKRLGLYGKITIYTFVAGLAFTLFSVVVPLYALVGLDKAIFGAFSQIMQLF